MTGIPAALAKFCAAVAERIPGFETGLPDGWPHDRDTTLVYLAMRSAADASCPGSAAATEWVDYVRAGMTPAPDHQPARTDK